VGGRDRDVPRQRSSRLAVAALAVGLAGLLASCASVQRRAVDVPVSFNCVNPVAVYDELPDGWAIYAGVAAFPVVDVHQRGRAMSGIEGGPRLVFSKIPIAIRADHSLGIEVSPNSGVSVRLDWGISANVPASSIDVRGCEGVCHFDNQPECPLGETGDWVVYPGGMWSAEPACVSVRVMTETEAKTVRFPLGVGCT